MCLSDSVRAGRYAPLFLWRSAPDDGEKTKETAKTATGRVEMNEMEGDRGPSLRFARLSGLTAGRSSLAPAKGPAITLHLVCGAVASPLLVWYS